VQLKAQLRGSSPHWTSGNILVQVLVSGVLVALFVVVAIAAFRLITSSNKRSKYSGDLQIVSEPTPTPSSVTEPRPTLPNANPVYCGTVGTVPAENSIQPIHLAQVPSPTATPQPTAIVNDAGSHLGRLSAADRKNAERERRRAERKRSRLEAMYQNHLISSAAYKRGQDEYQSEIAKYHSQLNVTVLTQDTAEDQNSARNRNQTSSR
jgi:hypothetical protein